MQNRTREGGQKVNGFKFLTINPKRRVFNIAVWRSWKSRKDHSLENAGSSPATATK